MNIKTLLINYYKIHDKESARQWCVDWQAWQSEQSLSYGELAWWQDHVQAIAEEYGLQTELEENGIL